MNVADEGVLGLRRVSSAGSINPLGLCPVLESTFSVKSFKIIACGTVRKCRWHQSRFGRPTLATYLVCAGYVGEMWPTQGTCGQLLSTADRAPPSLAPLHEHARAWMQLSHKVAAALSVLCYRRKILSFMGSCLKRVVGLAPCQYQSRLFSIN